MILYSHVFEDLHDLREKGIRDLGDDETENTAATRNQSPRLRVREIAQHLDCAPNAFGQARINRWNMIEGTGHSRRRHLGVFRHFSDVQFPLPIVSARLYNPVPVSPFW